MDRDPREWSGPQWLLVALTAVLAVSVIIGLSTSGAAFGVYNPAWDGASTLIDVAEDSGADADVALNTSVYVRVDPSRTVVVILSPAERYTAGERARIRAFVENGGTLVVAEDFGPVGNSVLSAVGSEVRFDGHLLRDERNYRQAPVLPVATNVSEDLQRAGVQQLTLNYGTVLTGMDGANRSVMVRSSEFAYLDTDSDGELDTNESLRRRPVVVRESIGNGTVLSVSDPSLFINAMLEAPDNRAFVRTLFDGHERVILDYSGFESQPPLSVALLWLRRTLVGQGLLVGLGLIAVLAVSRRHRVLSVLPASLRPVDGDPGAVGFADRAALREFLAVRHPEWDRDRLDRVIAGILTRRDREEGDD